MLAGKWKEVSWSVSGTGKGNGVGMERTEKRGHLVEVSEFVQLYHNCM